MLIYNAFRNVLSTLLLSEDVQTICFRYLFLVRFLDSEYFQHSSCVTPAVTNLFSTGLEDPYRDRTTQTRSSVHISDSPAAINLHNPTKTVESFIPNPSDTDQGGHRHLTIDRTGWLSSYVTLVPWVPGSILPPSFAVF
jgi:hypothetical protein